MGLRGLRLAVPESRAQLWSQSQLLESAWNIGDPSSIPGSGRSPGEGIGYLHQYSWASLVTQSVKNPPAMQEPGFNPWVGKIPQRRARQPTPVLLPGGSPWTEKPGRLQSIGSQRVSMTERLSTDARWNTGPHHMAKVGTDYYWKRNGNLLDTQSNSYHSPQRSLQGYAPLPADDNHQIVTVLLQITVFS